MTMTRLLTAACLTACLSAPVFAQTGPTALFDRFDANSDGAVTLDEVKAWRAQFFTAADADENGYVTRAELDSIRAQAETTRGGEGRQRLGRRGRDADPIARYDADEDGQLSHAEFVDAPFPAIDRLDANNDGRLTRDELPTRRRRG